MFEFDWKFQDFEIRTTKGNGHPYVELVKWYDYKGRRVCFTLAYWYRDKDGGYCLHFVGDRPLEYIAEIDVSVIWKQLFLAQKMYEDAEKKGEVD